MLFIKNIWRLRLKYTSRNNYTYDCCMGYEVQFYICDHQWAKQILKISFWVTKYNSTFLTFIQQNKVLRFLYGLRSTILHFWPPMSKTNPNISLWVTKYNSTFLTINEQNKVLRFLYGLRSTILHFWPPMSKTNPKISLWVTKYNSTFLIAIQQNKFLRFLYGLQSTILTAN